MLLRHTPFTATAAVALLLLGGLSTGCTSGPSISKENPAQDTVSTTGQDTMSQKRQYARLFWVVNPAVTAHELDCIKKDFPIYVQQQAHGAQRKFEERKPALQLTVGSLKKAVADLPCKPASADEVMRAIIVHHGLLANGQYDAFLQMVCLTYHAGTGQVEYAATDDGYTVDGQGNLVYDPTGLSKWNSSGGPGARYQNKTFLLPKPNGSWNLYDPLKDVRAMVFPYERQVEYLITHNNLSDTDLLQLVPYAEATTREEQGNGTYKEDGYYHGVAWVPVGVTLDNDRSTSPPFKNKAANLGAPCPVNCPNSKFIFQTTGVKPRKTC